MHPGARVACQRLAPRAAGKTIWYEPVCNVGGTHNTHTHAHWRPQRLSMTASAPRGRQTIWFEPSATWVASTSRQRGVKWCQQGVNRVSTWCHHGVKTVSNGINRSGRRQAAEIDRVWPRSLTGLAGRDSAKVPGHLPVSVLHFPAWASMPRGLSSWRLPLTRARPPTPRLPSQRPPPRGAVITTTIAPGPWKRKRRTTLPPHGDREDVFPERR